MHFITLFYLKKKSIIIKHIGDILKTFVTQVQYFYSGNALVDQMPKIGVLNGQRDRPTELDSRTCTIAAKGRHLADIYCHDTNMLS